MSQDKYAILFPGIGYHNDKPLLYYGKKLARQYGYQIIEVSYSGFPANIRGDAALMKQSFQLALDQSMESLKDRTFDEKSQILILSKSIGTAVAAAWQKQAGLTARNIYFTPVKESFAVIDEASGIVFHGTADPWADTTSLLEECQRLHLPCYLTEEANHSMETGDALRDLCILQDIMKTCQAYMCNCLEDGEE